MKFEVYKMALIQKRPSLANRDTRIEMSAGELLRLLEQVHSFGVEEGKAAQKSSELFKGIFGI